MDFGRMLRRAGRAAALDTSVYEEVEHDPAADQEALWIVIIAAALNGLGGGLASYMELGGLEQGAVLRFLWGVASVLLMYFIWAGVTYYVGTGYFGGKATPAQLRRTLGFAAVPMALGLFQALLGEWALLGFLVGAVWFLAAGFVALRQALDISNTRTLVVFLVGGGVALMIVMTLTFLFGFGVVPLVLS